MSAFAKPPLWQRLRPAFEGFDGVLALAVALLVCGGMLVMYSVGFDHGTRFVNHARNMMIAAGILFGALRAGAVIMQANQGVPIDIVLVVQSMIVLFIAAPPLVRSMFGLSGKRKRAKASSAESTVAGDTK